MSLDPELKLHRAIDERLAVVREFSETEPIKHVLMLLDLIKTSQLHDLAEVAPDQLQAKQGALRQVIALHGALTKQIGISPKA